MKGDNEDVKANVLGSVLILLLDGKVGDTDVEDDTPEVQVVKVVDLDVGEVGQAPRDGKVPLKKPRFFSLMSMG